MVFGDSPWVPIGTLVVAIVLFLTSAIITGSKVPGKDDTGELKGVIIGMLLLNLAATVLMMLAVGLLMARMPAQMYIVQPILVGIGLFASLSALSISVITKL